MNVKKSDPNSQKATPINSPAASNLTYCATSNRLRENL